ncbi:MAG: Rrf2 family transcriptional regulator [Acidobacteria bacterium]|nr:Rrf2 family transcriptional regulator [Acidobacteriota bacterium]
MLSATSEHVLRALILLAQLPEEQMILGRELAHLAEVPSHYLSKILLTLRNAGIIETSRGSRGGYRLCRRPEDIHLIEVIELFDPRAKRTCLLGHKRSCGDIQACSAHESWRAVRDAYFSFLTNTTLADIAHKSDGSRRSVQPLMGNDYDGRTL